MALLPHLFRSESGSVARATLFEPRDLATRARGDNEAVIRALCNTAYLGDGRALARVLGRYKMFVDTRDIGHSTHLMLDGYWEMWTTMAIAAAVRPGMTCVDIGANLGYFTLLMADLAGPQGRVHAFEPNPPIAARLRDTLAINGFGACSVVHETALGDREGAVMRLVVPEGEPKNAHLIDAAASDRETLVTRRLDGIPELGAPDLIKIDADTSEERIWEGMQGILDSDRRLTVFLEFAAVRYRDPRAFLARITGAGFALSRLDPASGAIAVDHDAVIDAPEAIDQMLVLVR